MPRIKKYADGQKSNLNEVVKLSSFQTYIIDDSPNSTYFKVTELKDTFTGGKNGFLIEGTEHLKESTEIKIQILDVNGNPVYYEPGNGVPEYYEGASKLIAVYVYEDTPIGEANITILGELKTYIDESGNTLPIPDEWTSVYNVKWEKRFKINKLLSNEDKVRFYRRPQVSINEIVKPIYSNIVSNITKKGTVDGFAQVPQAGVKLTDFSNPTNYLIQINDGGAWTGSVVGTTIQFADLGFSSIASDVINKTDLYIQTPYTINGIVSDFSNQGYTASFNYVEGLDNLKTALTGSFAKITLSDLTTFVGDVARVKIFRKSQSDLSDYQFIQEIQLESNEVLRDLETTTKNEEYYGGFDLFNYKNYWLTSSNNITTQFNQNYLYNSVKLNSSTTNLFFTSKSLDISPNTEYSLTFNARVGSPANTSDSLKVYLSGSRQSNFNNVITSVGTTQNILTLTSDNSLLQKSQINANFKAEDLSNVKLVFEVKGTDWYISDVSLRASQETSFSPDEITFIQPIPRTLPRETFDFRFQFYDINNNYIPVIVEESKTFDGGNLNVINKNLDLVPSNLYFQFDSGSGNGNPVPPTVISIDVIKSYLTGSVTYTSRSYDFFGNELSSSQYVGGQMPGLLLNRETDLVTLTVSNFTGSREDIIVQYIEFTGECEGVTDSFVITRVIDGKGGVNYEIRPYRGTVIRNNDPSGSLEVQAVRIDGINELNIRSGLPYGRSNNRLYVASGSYYITLTQASASGFIKGVYPGLTGSGELDYNAVFNRDSIDGQRTIYLIGSGSEPTPSQPTLTASIYTTLTLTDLLDGIDAGFVTYDTDTFTINPRLTNVFTPPSASATASFYRRGTNTNPISGSVMVYPSMSINVDYVPEYWVYYTTQSFNNDIKVVATDDNNFIISSTPYGQFIGNPISQSKTLTINWTYIEPYSSESVSVNKTFTIVPEGKPGDESIVFEVTPINVTLAANSRGIVNDYRPSITEIKVKQGSKYLIFSSSAASDPFKSHGQFHIATASIVGNNITPGQRAFLNNPVSVGQSMFGGTIGYILQPGDTGFDENLVKGLVVSVNSYVTEDWGCSGTYIGTSPNFGTGLQNTNSIITTCTTAGIPAKVCADLVEGGYSDWYLPSSEELTKIWQNRNSIGGWNNAFYWTSTDFDATGAYLLTFSPGFTGTNPVYSGIKDAFTNGGRFFRPVRSFSIPYDPSGSLFFGPSSNFTQLSGSIEYPLTIHPYYTSSIYTASVFVNYTKVLDGPPPIEIIISPLNATINANEIGYVSESAYRSADTSIRVREGNDFLTFTTQSAAPGTWRITLASGSNIATQSLSSSSFDTATLRFRKFDDPYVSASVLYNILVYPYALGAGHQYTSSLYTRTQTFTKNVAPPNARAVSLSATSQLVNFDRDGQVTSPLDDITLTATAFNTTGSVYYQFFKDGSPETGIQLSNTYTVPSYNATLPGQTATWKVTIRDGSNVATQPIRAAAEISIAGVKTGADAYSFNATNENTSITADLWTTEFSGSSIQIRGFKGPDPLEHTSSYVPSQEVYNYLDGTFLGNLGYYSASIFTSSSFVGVSGSKFPPSNPATLPDLRSWYAPAINKSGQVIYKIDFENAKQVSYVTQSIAVQFTPPAPYSANLSSENGGIMYRVSGELEFDLSTTTIRVFRGDLELTNVSSFSGGKLDAYGNLGYPNQCRVSILSYSGHLTLAGGLTAGSHVSGTPASFAGISGWSSPETIASGEIVFQIDCEGRETLYKTLSLSVVYEGNTGPGIVMRGIWSSTIDYIAEIVNQRRDAVIWPDPATVNKETHYWAAITGSGPGTPVGAQQPDGTVPYADTAYWQYLGEEEFFVSAKIAIFEESYVKNTLNVGTKDGTGAFANIVIAGGRTDPYIAIGQTGTQGTQGTGVSIGGAGVIGYNRPGIFLGVYEDGANGTTGRFSIKTTGTSGKGMYWDGDQLTIVGSIRQRQPGIPEGSYRGIWAPATAYYPDDTVRYGTSTYINSVTHTSTNDNNINTGYPPDATNTWAVSAASGTSGVDGSSGTGGTSGQSGTSGTAGGPGPGVVYRGLYSSTTKYYYDLAAGRRDIVKFGSNYYIAKNAAKNDTATWGQPNTTPADWETFGAQFSSVATDVLFAVEQYVDKTINIGAKGANALITLNANESGSNANPYISIGQISSSIFNGWVTESQVQGFNNNGIFIGYDASQPKVSLVGVSGSLVWNGEDLNIRGSINSNDGQIGGWTIGEGSIISSNQNIQLVSEPSESIAVFDDSGSLRFFANTQLTLPSPTGVSYPSASILGFTTSSIQTNGIPNDGSYNTFYGGTIAYDYYIIPSVNGSFTAGASGQHIITYTMPGGFSSYIQATGDADAYMNAALILTKTGYAPQFYTEYIATSNYAQAYAQGSVQAYTEWNGFQYVTSYYPISQTDYLETTKFSIIADLQQGVTYYLTLKGYLYVHSKDTSDPTEYPPYGFDSEVSSTWNISSAGLVTIKTVSAGTVVNGGGFQAVLADDKFLRVKDGISGSYNFSTEVTGSLMVDRAISNFSQAYGYPPAVKAFCRVTYNGTSPSSAANYTVSRRFNISSTLGLTGNQYALTFQNAFDANDYSIFITPSSINYATIESALMPMITANSATGFEFRMEKPDEANPGMQTVFIGAGNNTVSYANEFVDIVVIGR